MIPAFSFKRITFRLFLTAILAVSLLAVLPFAGGRAYAQSTPGYKTDRAVYPKPPLPARPAAGGKYTDPVFGTQIMRVTDEADENTVGCSTFYSHWPTFNANNTRLLIRKGENGNAMVKNFDPVTFTLGETVRPQLPQLPDGTSATWESATWHPTDPDIIYTFPLYYDGGMKLYSYNVKDNTFTLVKDFSSLASHSTDYLKQMYVSADGDVFAWLQMSIRTGSNAVYAYLVWRKSTDQVLAHTVDTYTGGINEIHVDKSGKYVSIHLNQLQPDNSRTRFLNLETGAIEVLYMNSSDRPGGHGDLGAGTFVGADYYQAGIHLRSLNDIHHPRMVLRFQDAFGNDDWTQDFHGSMLADDENWMTIGTYDDPAATLPDSGVFEDELIQVSLDGSGDFRRLAHTRSRIDNQTSTTGYWAMPKPTISKDGRYIAFTSNWEKSGRYDMYIAKVDPPGSADPDPTPTPAPQLPSMVASAQATASALAASADPSAAQINQLTTDIQTAYGMFQAEATRFTSAGEIDVNLRAAYYFSRAAAALASAGAPTVSIQDRLLIAAARLSQASSLMQPASASAALSHAASASAMPVIGTADLRSQASLGAAVSAGSLGLITGNAAVSPLAPETADAKQADDGSFPYELIGVSVTIGGRAAQVISVSPAQVKFYLPPDIPSGTAELLVTSKDGSVSQGTAVISTVAPAIFTTGGTGTGAAVAFNAATYLPGSFDVTTESNFGTDKRTRLALFSTGVSANVPNKDLANDILGGIAKILNLAESVKVEARTGGGQTILLPVEYAGRQNTMPGLDQVVFILPPELKGAGEVELTLIVVNQRSNTATVYVK